MIKFIIGVILLLIIAGCTTTSPKQIITTKQEFIVISPPTSLLYCPRVKDLPAPETLTNAELASLIVRFERNLGICANNMDALRKYIKEAKRNISSK